jgi:hypothetical protein
MADSPPTTPKPAVDATHTGTGVKDAAADGSPTTPLVGQALQAPIVATTTAVKAAYAIGEKISPSTPTTEPQASAESKMSEEEFSDKALGYSLKEQKAQFEKDRTAAAQEVKDKANEDTEKAAIATNKLETGRGVVAFSEQKQGPHPAYYVAARVFISGVEVTNYLTGTLSVTYAGRDGHNTASFTLQCAEDNFIITNRNSPGLEILKKEYERTITWSKEMAGSNVKTTGSTTTTTTKAEVEQRNQSRWRMAPDVPLYSEHAKKKIFEYKNKHPNNPILLLDGQQQGDSVALKPGEVPSGKFSGSRMWPLQADRPIFHKNDPVRIFIHNPLHHPLDSGDEQWLPAFAGFIDSYPWSEDYLTGHKDIQISCYDLRALMRYMRVINVLPQTPTTGPNTPAGRELNLLRDFFGANAGSMFLLMEMNTITKNMLAGLSFPAAVQALILGEKSPAGGVLGNSQSKLTPVGPGFGMGQTMYYGGTKEKLVFLGDSKHSVSSTDLDTWHTLCLCGPRELGRYFHRRNKDTGDATGSYIRKHEPYFTSKEVTQLGEATVWWEDDGTPKPPMGRACPANQQLHMLLPGGGTVFNTLYSFEQAGPTMESTDLDYTDRFTLINELCNLLDYHWTVSPFGDLIFEFPMYDFFPSPGDRRPGTTRSTKAGTAPTNAGPEDKKHMGFQKWAGAFTLDWQLNSASYNDESGEITTILFADGPLTLYNEGSTTASFQNRSMLFVPTLLRRLGAVTATQNFTFITKKTAICRAGLLELRRRLGRVATCEVQTVYRPFLLTNRPLYVAPRQRCGTISSVTHTMELNANAGTSASLQYIRHRDQFGNWTHVTGAENMPLDFTLMSDYANFKDFAKHNWIVDGICAPCLDENDSNVPPGGTGGGGGGSGSGGGGSGYTKTTRSPQLTAQQVAALVKCTQQAKFGKDRVPPAVATAIAGAESNGEFLLDNKGKNTNAAGLWQETGASTGKGGAAHYEAAHDPVSSTNRVMGGMASNWDKAERLTSDIDERVRWTYIGHNMGGGALDHALDAKRAGANTFDAQVAGMKQTFPSPKRPWATPAAIDNRVEFSKKAASNYDKMKYDASIAQPTPSAEECQKALDRATYQDLAKNFKAGDPPASQPAPASQPTS